MGEKRWSYAIIVTRFNISFEDLCAKNYIERPVDVIIVEIRFGKLIIKVL